MYKRGDRMTQQYLEQELSDLKTRVTNLETKFMAKINSDNKTKNYTDADINGTRQSVANVTPITFTEKGYIQDKTVRFNDVPKGNVTVFCEVPYTLYQPDGCNWLEVRFDEPLTKVIEVTISIL